MLHIGLTLIAIFGKILEADFKVFSFFHGEKNGEEVGTGWQRQAAWEWMVFFGLRLFDNPGHLPGSFSFSSSAPSQPYLIANHEVPSPQNTLPRWVNSLLEINT